jgi:hypothetical protein
MLLRGHALESAALPCPHRPDVEEDIRPPRALLGLVRLEQVDRRRAQHTFAGVVAVGLRDHARVLCQAGGFRMIWTQPLWSARA